MVETEKQRLLSVRIRKCVNEWLKNMRGGRGSSAEKANKQTKRNMQRKRCVCERERERWSPKVSPSESYSSKS